MKLNKLFFYVSMTITLLAAGASNAMTAGDIYSTGYLAFPENKPSRVSRGELTDRLNEYTYESIFVVHAVDLSGGTIIASGRVSEYKFSNLTFRFFKLLREINGFAVYRLESDLVPSEYRSERTGQPLYQDQFVLEVIVKAKKGFDKGKPSRLILNRNGERELLSAERMYFDYKYYDRRLAGGSSATSIAVSENQVTTEIRQGRSAVDLYSPRVRNSFDGGPDSRTADLERRSSEGSSGAFLEPMSCNEALTGTLF